LPNPNQDATFVSDFREMAEWSIAAVLKTVDLYGSGGSNPSLSAKQKLQFSANGGFAAFFMGLRWVVL
jgi:hypothetical protein